MWQGLGCAAGRGVRQDARHRLRGIGPQQSWRRSMPQAALAQDVCPRQSWHLYMRLVRDYWAGLFRIAASSWRNKAFAAGLPTETLR